MVGAHGVMHVGRARPFMLPPPAGPQGNEVQDALQPITGRRTVPQVFVGGKFIGGCDGG